MVLPEGYFLVLCTDSQRPLIFSEWKREIEPTRHMRLQSQQIGPIVIDRAFNLFRVQYKCFVCISINWILHRLGAERVCLNRPLAERWIPGNDYRMLYQLHYEVSTLRIIAMRGLIATQLLRERCVILFGRMESRCFNVFQWRASFHLLKTNLLCQQNIIQSSKSWWPNDDSQNNLFTAQCHCTIDWFRVIRTLTIYVKLYFVCELIVFW